MEDNGKYHILSAGCLSIKDAAFWRRKLTEKRPENATVNFKRVLYDPTLRTVVAGDTINVPALINDPELQKLEVQLKFLNGETDVAQYPLQTLKEWLKSNGPERILNAAHHINEQRGKSDFELSTLEKLFEEVICV